MSIEFTFVLPDNKEIWAFGSNYTGICDAIIGDVTGQGLAQCGNKWCGNSAAITHNNIIFTLLMKNQNLWDGNQLIWREKKPQKQHVKH